MADETVTIEMPQDAPKTETSTSTVEIKVEEEQIPEKAQEVGEITPEEEKPQRNEKGQFVEGNQEAKGLENSGRPCEFCQKPVEIISKVNLYREWCRGNVDGKLHIPYLEELVSEDYLDITIDQFEDWVNPANHKEQHSELTRTCRKLMTRQKLYLLKRTLGDNPRGAMFQLSANHGVIEKAGRVIGGDPDNKLEIILTEERKLPDAE